MGRPALTFVQRVQSFWSCVTIGAPDECWNYRGKRYEKSGYPCVSVAGCKMSGHRFVYLLERGPIPDGLQVLHSCDNRNCMNPRHFFLGTQQDNLIDCAKKGRLPRARLTAKDVREMRALHEAGHSLAAVGRRYNMLSSTVCNIVRRRRWAFIH